MNYIKIDTEDVCNGDGLRVVLWLSGCSHHCYNCQNPQTWDVNSGIPFGESAKEELFRELDKDYISGLTLTGGDPLHETNLDAVLDIVTEFNKRYRTIQNIVPNEDYIHNILNDNSNEIRLSFGDTKTIWIYSGYKFTDFFFTPIWKASEIENNMKRKQIIGQCDVMVDDRYIDSQRDITLKWCGSANQRVINVQQSLQKGEVVLWDV